MEVKKKQRSKNNEVERADYYDAVSKILTFVDKVDKSKNKKKKGDL